MTDTVMSFGVTAGLNREYPWELFVKKKNEQGVIFTESIALFKDMGFAQGLADSMTRMVGLSDIDKMSQKKKV